MENQEIVMEESRKNILSSLWEPCIFLQQINNSSPFPGSPTPRSPRSAAVKFRVGQVVKHKRWGYRGIIIGWDPSAKVSFTLMHYNVLYNSYILLTFLYFPVFTITFLIYFGKKLL